MIMKVHKINKIDKQVCCCEQKIAYNYAVAYYSMFKKIKDSDSFQSVNVCECNDIITMFTNWINEDESMKKYNIDAIIHCLRYSIINDIYKGEICSSYEKIGKLFPIMYQIA